MLEMDELIVFDVEMTAEWRQQLASEYPDDAARNLAAAQLLNQLAQELRSLDGTTLHQRLDAVLTNGLDERGVISQATRDVGFRWFPASAGAFLEVLISNLEQTITRTQPKENSSTAIRSSRGKVWLHLATGESAGRPLAEWGYRTPRFPLGVKESDLADLTPEILQETMIAWFLMNHVPARGPYFGFAETNTASRLGVSYTAVREGLSPNGSVEIAGFDLGRFFNGGTAADLLKAEFGHIIDELFLTKVSALFEGLWEQLPANSFVDLESKARAQWPTTIAAALDDLTEFVRKTAPQYGGIGHNGPPEDVLTEDDRRIILTASADARLSVLSSDYSAAALAWGMVKPVVDKIASAVNRHVDNFLNKFTTALGFTMALVVTGYVGNLLGLWDKSQAITTMLELAKNLSH